MIYLQLIAILALSGVQSMQNGRRANITEFPYVVSIQYQLYHLCGGTIIDKYHILTIAHVVVPHPASGLLVVHGRSVLTWPYYTVLTVNNIYRHPDYKELTILSFGQINMYWENDIAILRLSEPLLLVPFFRSISFSTTNFESYRCFECTMISWNYSDRSNFETVVLMWDIVLMVENNRCEQRGIHVVENQQCFIDLVETAFISTEDLGSPIICGGSMVGLIAKEARQGDATSPATFLSTFNYAEFIAEIINDGGMNVQSEEFPYMVSIWHRDRHACGGIIVNAYQVFTAAQCIRGLKPYHVESFKIAFGSNSVSPTDHSVQWYLVEYIEVYPLYIPIEYLNDSSRSTEHNIGIIMVSRPFSWSPPVQRFKFADADDFYTKQLCQILHWTRNSKARRRESWKLMKTTAVLVDSERAPVQLGIFQIAAKKLYSVKSPLLTDIGSPIICGGQPLGIMIKIYSINVQSETPLMIFLRLRPYISMQLLDAESNWYIPFTFQRENKAKILIHL